MCSRAHCSMSVVRQIGPIARRAIGRGKSALDVYRARGSLRDAQHCRNLGKAGQLSHSPRL